MENGTLGRELHGLRGDKTLREVAKETGYDFTWLSKVENGREYPSWDALKKILKFYGEKDLRRWAYLLLLETREEQFGEALAYKAR